MLKKIAKWTIGLVAAVALLFAIAVAIVYSKQDDIVQELIAGTNKSFAGKVSLADSHISIFADFPFIDIDLEQLHVHPDKTDTSQAIIALADCYIGFDLWTILNGKFEIKKIHLENGLLDVVQYADGSFNITRAFESEPEASADSADFHLDLKSILLKNIRVNKLNAETGMKVDLHFSDASTSFLTNDTTLLAGLDSKFDISIIMNDDTTFIKQKHFELATDFIFNKSSKILNFKPTEAKLEGAVFNLEGTLDFSNDVFLDLIFRGNKPNFELFLAMAPAELTPVLKKYDNKGQILFETTVLGSCINGKSPAINATFSCNNAFLENTEVNKKLEDLNFSGYFTNGDSRNPTTMEFGIKDLSAKPEAGLFKGNLVVKNFESPDIDLQLISDFELNFLAKFLGLTDLYDLTGKVELTMNFKDIIDLEHPERSIEKLNESYFTKLRVENLSFGKESTELPVRDVDISAVMEGHEARIEFCNIVIGSSDISIKGTVSDLPAIIHHTDQPIEAKLEVAGNLLDLKELTKKDSTAFDEQIKNYSMKAHFNTSARKVTESPNLPIGEFFIDELNAQMTHYPHKLHDFRADVVIEPEDFRVIDFSGMIDKSDFHFFGRLRHYELWFMETPRGDTHLDFNLKSNMLQLEDIFSYRGANYVPEDYRHEEFDKLIISGAVDMHFQDSLQSIDLDLRNFGAKMKLHAMRFNDLKGRVHFEKEHLVVEKFGGHLGNSDLLATLHYYLGKDKSLKKRENKFELNCKRLDFDQLFQFQLPGKKQESNTSQVAYHDEGFNVYELPFSEMTFDVSIGNMNYKKYLIQNIDGTFRTTTDHLVYIDQFSFRAADGEFKVKGLLDATDPKRIYFDPDMTMSHVDLDKLFFKFDNFGQDYLVSENVHGTLDAGVRGHIRVHKDLSPIMEESEIKLDLKLYNGRLDNVAMFDAMTEYFRDKNLKKVFFDTLSNQMSMNRGILEIPKMTINSSIGFMEISGTQDMNLNMDYYLRIPWKMVTDAASSKLFGKNREAVDPEQIDEIQSADPKKRIRYLNIRLKGNTENYTITLEKEKKSKAG